MGYAPVAPKVAAFFAQNPNRVVWLDEIAQATGLDKRTVQNAIGNSTRAAHEWTKGLRVDVRGQAWIFDNSIGGRKAQDAAPQVVEVKPAVVDRMFEQIGVTTDGVPIVRSEDGVLYRLVGLK